MPYQFQVIINGLTSTYTVEAEPFWGEDQVLLTQETDLAKEAHWQNAGFCVTPFLDSSQFQLLKESITQFIKGKLSQLTGKVIDGFSLENYHHFVDDHTHLRLVRETAKGYNFEYLALSLNQLLSTLSTACGTKVRLGNPDFPNMDVFCIRLVRPHQKGDFNPPHKDVYLNRLKNAINVYLPIAGSTNNSSLPVLPNSHQLAESAIYRTLPKAIVNQTSYSVPCIAAVKGGMNMIRPNPLPGELLIFSPYLIHGGGENQQKDTTRVSLELRFWKA